MQYESEESFEPVGVFNVNYLDQITKRNDDKRQLKIIRLKKDEKFSTKKRSNEQSGIITANSVGSEKHPVSGNSIIPSDGSNFVTSHGGNQYKLDDGNLPNMSKRALKILRLKKYDPRYDDIMMPKLKTLNPNPIYLRHFNADKRALKIIRLKKNQKSGNSNTSKYLNFHNPSKQFWNRFGRSNEGFGRTVRDLPSLGTHDDSNSPQGPLGEAINLYSRFY